MKVNPGPIRRPGVEGPSQAASPPPAGQTKAPASSAGLAGADSPGPAGRSEPAKGSPELVALRDRFSSALARGRVAAELAKGGDPASAAPAREGLEHSRGEFQGIRDALEGLHQKESGRQDELSAKQAEIQQALEEIRANKSSAWIQAGVACAVAAASAATAGLGGSAASGRRGAELSEEISGLRHELSHVQQQRQDSEDRLAAMQALLESCHEQIAGKATELQGLQEPGGI